MLVAGFVCNSLVRPVASKWFIDTRGTAPVQASAPPVARDSAIGTGQFSPVTFLAWIAVGIPIAWGVWITLSKSLVLFR